MLLNQAAGSDTSCVATALTDVDAWLVAHPPGSGVMKKNEAKAYFDRLTSCNDWTLCAPPV